MTLKVCCVHGLSIMLCYATDAGQKLLDSLAETWDFFFCDVLSMLQAIFHPVQVHQHRRCQVDFFNFISVAKVRNKNSFKL